MRRKPTPKPNTPTPQHSTSVQCFSFGDPIPVLDRKEILDYLQCQDYGQWYEPPLSWEGLARSLRANVHHASAIHVKRNALISTFIPHPHLNRSDFSRLVMDYLVFGNAYLEKHTHSFGGLLKLQPALAKFVRRSNKNLDEYLWIPQLDQIQALGDTFHLMEPDINQELYGLPEYLAALNSAWLNESATLFRRKYYLNGSHAGFILYVSDAAHKASDVDAMREQLKQSKGIGNFKNLFLYAPGGKKDGIQVIPLSEVATKDEFFNIKNVTRDDVLAAHRVPPQLMGIIPNNTGGFGKASEAAEVFYTHEIQPLQARLSAINDWLGDDIIQFTPYALASL